MASKNRPGHPARRPAAKTLKQKRAEKRAKRTGHRLEDRRPVEKTLANSR